VLLVAVRVIVAAQRAQDLGQVVHHKAVTAGEHLAPDDVDFPAGDVEMDAVEEGGVVELVGQLAKQIRMLEHVGHGVLGVAHEDHGCLGAQRLDAPREGLVGHVVLHDVDQGLVHALLLSGELVKGDTIPVADQADLSGRVVHEQLGNRHLAAGNQDAVRRELRVDVRFAGSLWAKFDQVVVALAKRDQADQLGQLAAAAEHLGIEADALDQQVDPLVGGELLAGLHIAVKIEMGQLDRLEGRQDPGSGVLVFTELILEVGDAPDAADQQLGVFFDRARIDKHLLMPRFENWAS
jgi:hypothetical protein